MNPRFHPFETLDKSKWIRLRYRHNNNSRYQVIEFDLVDKKTGSVFSTIPSSVFYENDRDYLKPEYYLSESIAGALIPDYYDDEFSMASRRGFTEGEWYNLVYQYSLSKHIKLIADLLDRHDAFLAEKEDGIAFGEKKI